MKLIIDISKDRYDEIMSMDWKNCRLIFDEEIRAIHDGKALEQQFCGDCISREAVMHILDEVGGDFDSPREAVVPIDYIADMVSDLPSVTPQPCEDAISRQAALEAIDVKAWEFCDYLIRNGRNDEQKPVSHFADNLRECVGEDLPSVTPQPKVGRWIMSDDGLYRPICNNCGAHPWKGYIPTVEEATDVFKYCPNCGAKISEIPTGAEGSEE